MALETTENLDELYDKLQDVIEFIEDADALKIFSEVEDIQCQIERCYLTVEELIKLDS